MPNYDYKILEDVDKTALCTDVRCHLEDDYELVGGVSLFVYKEENANGDVHLHYLYQQAVLKVTP